MTRDYDKRWQSMRDCRQYGSKEYPVTYSGIHNYQFCPANFLYGRLGPEESGEPTAYAGNVADHAVKLICNEDLWDNPDGAFDAALATMSCDGVDFSVLDNEDWQPLYREIVQGFAARGDNRKLNKRLIATDVRFIAPIGKYWSAGTMDLLYLNDAGDRVIIEDYKTCMTPPFPYALAHSWQFAIYANAVMRGELYKADGATLKADVLHEPSLNLEKIDAPKAFPRCIWYQARNDTCYKKRTGYDVVDAETGEVTRKFHEVGDRKGIPWIDVNLDPAALQERIIPAVEQTVAAIRMGNFGPSYPDTLGGCDRCCRHKKACEANIKTAAQYSSILTIEEGFPEAI